MSGKLASFGYLFNQYRLQAGFLSLGEFGRALAEEGYVYEDSIFSKWKSGDRLPRERKLVLALIKLFAQNDERFSLEDGNALLESLDLRDMNPIEIQEVFKNTTRMLDEQDYYQKYRSLDEPNVLFQNLKITEDNLKVRIVDEILDPEEKRLWKYYVRCAIADYYSKLSDGKKTPAEVFQTLAWDYYEQQGRTFTVVLTVVDDVSSEEYVALTLRCVRGDSRDKRVLEVFDLFGCTSQFPHEVEGLTGSLTGELSRFVIPNWAWSYNAMLSRVGFWALVKYAKSRGVLFFYAVVSDYITHVLAEAGIRSIRVENAFPLHEEPQAKEKYPVAYEDARDYALFWQRFRPQLCYFETLI